jgi:hypothetical protein
MSAVSACSTISKDFESRIQALLAAPAGRAFLLTAVDSRLTPENIATPGVSLQFATFAVDTVWFAPLDESQQVWLSNDPEPRAEMFSSPAQPPISWERYAQKPAGGLFTSTLIGGSSSARVTVAFGTSDFADVFTPRRLPAGVSGWQPASAYSRSMGRRRGMIYVRVTQHGLWTAESCPIGRSSHLTSTPCI